MQVRALILVLAVLSAACGENERSHEDEHRRSDSKPRSRGEPAALSAREVSREEKALREVNLEKSYVGKVRSMDRPEVIAELDAGRISTLQELKALFPRGDEDYGKNGGFVFTVNIEGRDCIIIWADEFGRITSWQARDSY